MKELDEMNEAARKQKAAAVMKQQALAGVQPPPPEGGPPPDPNAPPPLTTPGQINSSQQDEIESADLLRKHEMESHMAAVRAGRSPNAVGSTIDLQHQTGVPGAAPGTPQAAPAVSGMFEIWRAILQDGEDKKLSDATIVYADDWAALRTALKNEKDGDWLAIRYQFPANVPNVLGFFAELRSPYKQPDDAVKERFDVIIKGTKVFRSEIDPDPEDEVEAAPEAEAEAEAPAEA